MKTYLTLSVLALFATSAISFAGPDAATMQAKENEAWQGYKDKNEAGFQKVVDKDIRCVYDSGIMTMADELGGMKKADMKSFSISDFKIFSDEKDVVVATYTVTLAGTDPDGVDVSGTYNAGTVWKDENGQWMAIFHTQAKQAPAAAKK
jgi:hypothetical protein